VTEAKTKLPRAFRAREWVEITPAFLWILSFVHGRADFASGCINRDLRESRLRAALVAADGTIVKLPDAAYWREHTVCAPHIAAEGVRVEPFEEGRWFIWKADLEREYPTTTSPAAADRQSPAAGAEPSQSLQAARQPPQPSPAAPPDESAPSSSKPATAKKRGKRRGPDRFSAADRALFPDMSDLMKNEALSPQEAAQRLGDGGKLKGRGSLNSRVLRLARSYRKEILKQ
jgi:hypothetical protein